MNEDRARRSWSPPSRGFVMANEALEQRRRAPWWAVTKTGARQQIVQPEREQQASHRETFVLTNFRPRPVNSNVGFHDLMKLWFVLILFGFVAASAHAQSKRGGVGSICVAPPDRPTTGEKSLANPAGGNAISVYSVQIDKMPVIVASNDRPTKISPISMSRKHLVKIIGDGKTVQSFWFTFNEFKTNDLCLWFKSLYETWSLWDGKEGRGLCRCK
jgi:hypothetical protein